jgi:hypothetical protein
MYGYDDEFAYLIDTRQQGGRVKTSLKSLALARSEKGPMSSRNLSYTIEGESNSLNLEQAIVQALRNNAREFTNPPITNAGYKGIYKTANELRKWFATSRDIEFEFNTAAMLMEKAGSGGALFRNLYRDFLKESYSLLKLNPIQEAFEIYSRVAPEWTIIAELFEKTAQTKDISHIELAAEKMKKISEEEKQAMRILSELPAV